MEGFKSKAVLWYKEDILGSIGWPEGIRGIIGSLVS